MISKRIKGRKDGKSSARAAMRYGEGLAAVRNRETGEINDKSHRTRLGNFGIVDDGVYAGLDALPMAEMIDLAALEMQSNCDLNTRAKSENKLAHFVVSFNQEKPAEAVLRDTEDSMLVALGLDNNHFATFLHNDNGYWHLHVFASCIEKDHPHRCNSLWQDRRKRDKICREIEVRHGLNRDNGLHEIDEHGLIIEVPLKERKAKREAKPKISDRSHSVERYSGEKSFQTWCNEIRIGDRLKHAKSWHDLHAAAAAYNCEVKSKGAGFVLCPIGEKGGISLSTLGLKKLPTKFGAFQVARSGQGVEAIKSYKPQPTLPGGSLYPEWQQAREKFRVIKSAATNQLRNTHATSRAELRKHQRAELQIIRSSTTGKELSVLVSVAKLRHAVELTGLSADQADERRQLRRKLADTAPGTTYRDFLVKQADAGSNAALERAREYGEAEATTVSRQREAEKLEVAFAMGGICNNSAPRLNFSHHVERSGTVVFNLGHGRQIIDSAVSKQIQLNNAAALDPSAVEISLRFAVAKFGNNLTLTGPSAFQKMAVELSVKKGLGVQFINPELDAYREKLEAEITASRFTRPVARATKGKSHTTEVSLDHNSSYASQASAPLWSHLNPVDLHDAIEDFLSMSGNEDGPPIVIRREHERSEAYAALVEQAKARGRVFEPKQGMQYVGSIKEISECGRFAIQDQGRGAVVIHDLVKLEGRFVVGQKASIMYRDRGSKDMLPTAEREANRVRLGTQR
ncbi:Relaxase/Mobilization nuclease domain protein [compost metagenome]